MPDNDPMSVRVLPPEPATPIVPEWQCPSCDATIRARLADQIDSTNDQLVARTIEYNTQYAAYQSAAKETTDALDEAYYLGQVDARRELRDIFRLLLGKTQ